METAYFALSASDRASVKLMKKMLLLSVHFRSQSTTWPCLRLLAMPPRNFASCHLRPTNMIVASLPMIVTRSTFRWEQPSFLTSPFLLFSPSAAATHSRMVASRTIPSSFCQPCSLRLSFRRKVMPRVTRLLRHRVDRLRRHLVQWLLPWAWRARRRKQHSRKQTKANQANPRLLSLLPALSSRWSPCS